MGRSIACGWPTVLTRAFDEAHLARVRDHHPTHMGPDHLGHRARVAAGLDHHVILARQRPGERGQVVARHADPPQAPDRAVFCTISIKPRWPRATSESK